MRMHSCSCSYGVYCCHNRAVHSILRHVYPVAFCSNQIHLALNKPLSWAKRVCENTVKTHIGLRLRLTSVNCLLNCLLYCLLYCLLAPIDCLLHCLLYCPYSVQRVCASEKVEAPGLGLPRKCWLPWWWGHFLGNPSPGASTFSEAQPRWYNPRND